MEVTSAARQMGVRCVLSGDACVAAKLGAGGTPTLWLWDSFQGPQPALSQPSSVSRPVTPSSALNSRSRETGMPRR